MSPLRSIFSWLARPALALPALAVLFTACATAPPSPPAKPSASPAKLESKPAFKKPPRMNGRGEVSSITLDQLFALKESGQTLIFDARPRFFYNMGHIPGAISLPKNQADAQIAEREAEIKAAIAAGKTIVVYCTGITCPDARTVAIHISGFGYPASIFSSGWEAWKDAGMPTE